MKSVLKKIINIPKRVHRSVESKKYRLGKYAPLLNILSPHDTMRFLLENNICFCRFGDGEIAIMRGESIPFQKYDKELACRLKEILKSHQKGLAVGIGYLYLNPTNNVNQFTQNFLNSLSMQRRFLIENCDKDLCYIDTSVTQIYQNYDVYDFETHFKAWQTLFKDKDITLICGKSVLDNIKYNALEVCNSVEYIYSSNKDAYDDYAGIFKRAMEVESNRIICVILGPTAKPLVFDLCKNGRIAWDIGHFLKDYDSYMRKIPRTDSELIRFFKPD